MRRYLTAVAVLNMYIVHDLNSLGAYTFHTVHEQIQWWRGTRLQTTCVLLLMCYLYTARNMICAYIGPVLHASIL